LYFSEKNGESVNKNKYLDNLKESLLQLENGFCGNIRCLVPMAIDQAPYFRLARDVAHVLECPKPAVIHSEFLPGLKQDNDKMSSTGGSENATLFLDMSPKEIADTIKKHAFSGGGKTLQEHRENGGNVAIDISYQYLTFLFESDEELEQIAKDYSNGELLSGQLKTKVAELISQVVRQHQEAKSNITDEILSEFFDSTRTLDIGGCVNRNDLTSDERTNLERRAGLDFDRTYGCKPKCQC
jgi:tryptophanyl-tRNA synthetase